MAEHDLRDKGGTTGGESSGGWTSGWGVVRQVQQKLEFVAFYTSRDDAEAAAATAIDCQVCVLTYKYGFDPPREKARDRK